MKVAIVWLACVAVVAATAEYNNKQDVKIADKNFLQKQKFLFEIVYRLDDPLMFEEYIKLGGNLIFDEAHYTHYDDYMAKFYQAYKYGILLPKGEFFGALSKIHAKQAFGLFKYFYYAKDWETFVKNVCWARIHVNEGIFFYALNLAVIHRDDFNGLILPSIYEVFPQYFFNGKFIYQAEKFDYDVWGKNIMYKKEYKDVYYTNIRNYFGNYDCIKSWQKWQWWKMMGLDERFYAEDKFIFRGNIDEFYNDGTHANMLKDLKIFWMPVDYTRDIEIFNYHSDLSYFTEDLDWNAYWYYLNMDYPIGLEGKNFGLSNERRGEYWIYNVQQILARYYMERLSHGYGDIEELSFYKYIETGYNPQLVHYNGVGFTYRKNYYEIYSYGNYQMYQRMTNAFTRMYDVIDLGYYKMNDGTVVDLRKPESIEYIGDLLQGNVDVYDKQFLTYWTMFAHMSMSNVDYYDRTFSANVFMNFETMMRDPLFYMFYKKVADVYYRFNYHLTPYTHKELLFEGVKIEDVSVDQLVTYFDFVDTDVTSLLNDKMTFVDGKFVWDTILLARQLRLNHKPFNFNISVTANKAYKAVVRAYLGPKYDEFGRTISLAENRENFIKLDEFVYDLAAGKNVIKRSSNDFYWTVKDRTTHTELYRYVMLAYDGKYEYHINMSQPHCGFPDRLVLPHGHVNGMPVQLFFSVTPFTGQQDNGTFDYTYSCSIGSRLRHIDDLPFGYPFDRVIDEYDLNVPNMYFKDVKIYHEQENKMFINSVQYIQLQLLRSIWSDYSFK